MIMSVNFSATRMGYNKPVVVFCLEEKYISIYLYIWLK